MFVTEKKKLEKNRNLKLIYTRIDSVKKVITSLLTVHDEFDGGRLCPCSIDGLADIAALITGQNLREDETVVGSLLDARHASRQDLGGVEDPRDGGNGIA